jgi:glutaredoxin
MKDVVMITADYCPYCRRARKYMDELFSEHPEFKSVPLSIVDEVQNREAAEKYNYHLVPSYFLNGKMHFTGAATKEDVERVFKDALNS